RPARADEDRNLQIGRHRAELSPEWRRPARADEDRNAAEVDSLIDRMRGGVGPPGPTRIATPTGPGTFSRPKWWRRPARADEDRNLVLVDDGSAEGAVASARQGRRGSQLGAGLTAG
ncbi:hypothetical protein, partial [Saccharopolyspora taberi]|uniref:hypothetical protein n=1 Tax=Saccharopolyspora taberi TaxID=60895 RepID=UPI003CD06032